MESTVVFKIGDVKTAIREYTGRNPSKSNLNRWMNDVLDLPPYRPGESRDYTVEDMFSLVFWVLAGEKSRKGPKSTRRKRRIKHYQELREQWLQNQSIN